MIQRILGWALIAVLIFGGAAWLAKPGNGKSAGHTAGQLGNTGKNAIGGVIDVGVGFVNGLSH